MEPCGPAGQAAEQRTSSSLTPSRERGAGSRDRVAVCASTEACGSLTGEIRHRVHAGFVKESFRNGNRCACTKREIERVELGGYTSRRTGRNGNGRSRRRLERLREHTAWRQRQPRQQSTLRSAGPNIGNVGKPVWDKAGLASGDIDLLSPVRPGRDPVKPGGSRCNKRKRRRLCESYQDKSGPCPIGKGIQSTNFEFN